jgi:hypothetical protein
MERHENFVRNMCGEDVVAWLPHSPMLAFDIIPSYGDVIGILPLLFISFMRSPSFILGYRG